MNARCAMSLNELAHIMTINQAFGQVIYLPDIDRLKIIRSCLFGEYVVTAY